MNLVSTLISREFCIFNISTNEHIDYFLPYLMSVLINSPILLAGGTPRRCVLLPLFLTHRHKLLITLFPILPGSAWGLSFVYSKGCKPWCSASTVVLVEVFDALFCTSSRQCKEPPVNILSNRLSCSVMEVTAAWLLPCSWVCFFFIWILHWARIQKSLILLVVSSSSLILVLKSHARYDSLLFSGVPPNMCIQLFESERNAGVSQLSAV